MALASLPDKIRGFGPIKMRSSATAAAERAALLERLRNGPAMLKAAEQAAIRKCS